MPLPGSKMSDAAAIGFLILIAAAMVLDVVGVALAYMQATA